MSTRTLPYCGSGGGGSGTTTATAVTSIIGVGGRGSGATCGSGGGRAKGGHSSETRPRASPMVHQWRKRYQQYDSDEEDCNGASNYHKHGRWSHHGIATGPTVPVQQIRRYPGCANVAIPSTAPALQASGIDALVKVGRLVRTTVEGDANASSTEAGAADATSATANQGTSIPVGRSDNERDSPPAIVAMVNVAALPPNRSGDGFSMQQSSPEINGVLHHLESAAIPSHRNMGCSLSQLSTSTESDVVLRRLEETGGLKDIIGSQSLLSQELLRLPQQETMYRYGEVKEGLATKSVAAVTTTDIECNAISVFASAVPISSCSAGSASDSAATATAALFASDSLSFPQPEFSWEKENAKKAYGNSNYLKSTGNEGLLSQPNGNSSMYAVAVNGIVGALSHPVPGVENHSDAVQNEIVTNHSESEPVNHFSQNLIDVDEAYRTIERGDALSANDVVFEGGESLSSFFGISSPNTGPETRLMLDENKLPLQRTAERMIPIDSLAVGAVVTAEESEAAGCIAVLAETAALSQQQSISMAKSPQLSSSSCDLLITAANVLASGLRADVPAAPVIPQKVGLCIKNADKKRNAPMAAADHHAYFFNGSNDKRRSRPTPALGFETPPHDLKACAACGSHPANNSNGVAQNSLPLPPMSEQSPPERHAPPSNQQLNYARAKAPFEAHTLAEKATLLAEQALSDKQITKNLLLSMALVRTNPRTPPSSWPPRGSTLIDRFHWASYPPLDNILRRHMAEYYELSTNKCQSRDQQVFNNKLVNLVRVEAQNLGWEFDKDTFDDKKIRDRIRCFFKTHIQNAKKRLKTMLKNPQKRANVKALAAHFHLIEDKTALSTKCSQCDSPKDDDRKNAEFVREDQGTFRGGENSVDNKNTNGFVFDRHDAAQQVLSLCSTPFKNSFK